MERIVLKKSIETCMKCYYGAFSSSSCEKGCANCPMFTLDNLLDLRCGCTLLKDDEECKYYTTLFSHHIKKRNLTK